MNSTVVNINERMAFDLVYVSDFYSDDNDGLEYGVEYGKYDEDIDELFVDGNQWFPVQKERDISL